MSDETPGAGHNSNVAPDRLRSLIERIERLEEEKKALASDIKDIYTEAKSSGYDTGVMRALVRLRAKDPDKLSEFEQMLEFYRSVMGC